MKFQAIGIPPEQAQFLETRKFQINEIARIFRVPPHMLADLEKSSFSNIEQQSLEFVKYTLDPWVIRWEMATQKALLLPSEKKQYFATSNLDGLLRGDYQSRMTGYATGRQNGWLSSNDIRELENMNPIPPELGGDLYLINGNMTKLQDRLMILDTCKTLLDSLFQDPTLIQKQKEAELIYDKAHNELADFVEANKWQISDQTEYQKTYTALEEAVKQANAEFEQADNAVQERLARKNQIDQFIQNLSEHEDLLLAFDETLWTVTVDEVLVKPSGELVFALKSGQKIISRLRSKL